MLAIFKRKCLTGKHKLKVVGMSPYTESYKLSCVWCGKEFYKHHNVVTPWDEVKENATRFFNWSHEA